MKLKTLAMAAVATAVFAAPGFARDQLKIVGSSTVFPYTQAVSEEFTKKTGKPSPVVESTGTGGGFKVFCGGVGESHPDITGASRAMKKSEFESCAKAGVTDISEALIGYDGLSMAVSQKSANDWNLTVGQIYLALASDIPSKDGTKIVPNYNEKWSDIDASLPNIKIAVFGPPPTSGTRDAFVELAMHTGCKSLEFFKKAEAADKKKFEDTLLKNECSRMRQDGLFVEAGENDNLIVQRLNADPNTLGIFGYSFLYENQDTLKGVKIGGVAPSFDTIADASYPLSRPLFFYVKNAHRKVIPGMPEFLEEYMSEGALGGDGYLAERGLTPLADDLREKVSADVLAGKSMAAPAK